MTLQDQAKHFYKDVRGASAIVFGVMSTVLLAVAGVAIDAGRGYNIRNDLQTALDAALLSAATQMYSADADLTDVARKYISINWRHKLGVDNIDIAVHLDGTGRLSGRAAARVPVTLGRVVGLDSMPVNVESEIVAGSQDVEAVLVVDNTGSMSGSKLDALKRSSRTLVEAVFASPRAEQHAKIGIVPFAQYVNVGMANRNKPWMSVAADSSIPREWCRDEAPVIGQTNCRMVSYTYYNDGVPHTATYETCDYQYGESRYICSPWNETYTWYGCAGSRNYPLNTLDDSYSTPVPGIMNAGCPSEITPLANDRRMLLDKIDALVAVGETYIPSGLIWGWRVLSKVEPFDEAFDYNEVVNGKPVRKIMVLMTDGANTKSPNYPAHDWGDAATSNTLTTELCNNVKARGIELYTIAFEVTDTTIKDILRSCATDPSRFFDASDSDALDVAFRNVARDMIALHVAR